MAFFRELFQKPAEKKKAVTYTKQPAVSSPTHSAKTVAQVGFPLAMAKSGQAQRVVAVKGQDETRRFLASLGFAEGAEVMLISEIDGNVIVKVKGTRVAVSKSMAMRVYVA